MDGEHHPHCCELCWAVVPRTLMHFHRDWHTAQEGRGPRYFERHGAQAELDRLIRVIDNLRSIPAVSAPTSSVATLRDQLMSAALELAIQVRESEPAEQCIQAKPPPSPADP